MVLESLGALDRAQVPDDAVMAVAHASEMAVLEVPHVVSMRWPAIPSILDRLESNRWAEGRSAGLLSVPASRLWWHQIFLPSEYGPAIQQRRRRALGGDEGFQQGSLGCPLEPARLVVETLQRLHLLVASKLCVLDGPALYAEVSS